MTSNVLSGNTSMLHLGASLGFTAHLAERGIMEMSLQLRPSSAATTAVTG
jgi:hypothetical protein